MLLVQNLQYSGGYGEKETQKNNGGGNCHYFRYYIYALCLRIGTL